MSDDFLEEFLADPFDNEGGGSEDIALVHVSFAWQAGKYEFGNDTRTNFLFNASSKEDMALAKKKCIAYIEENDLDGFPKLGVLIEIPIETFLTAHKKMTWDVSQFTNSYFASKFQMGEKGKLNTKQQDQVKGFLPYDLIIQSINQYRECLNKFVWARLSQEINWYTEAINQRRNEDYPNRIYIITEIFENEKAAYAAAGISIDSSNLSQHALDNGWSLPSLQEQSQIIHDAIAAALKGEGTPDNKPMSNKDAVEMVCANFVIKPEDLKLLEIEIAF
jgi:hypothetical protein